MALRPFQNSSSRLMLVLRPAITTDRLVTVEFMKCPFPRRSHEVSGLLLSCAPGANRASRSARAVRNTNTLDQRRLGLCSLYAQHNPSQQYYETYRDASGKTT